MRALPRLALLAAFGLTLSVRADELGRLFFTPSERSQLEQSHKVRQAENDGGEQSVITVNGVIQRSDGIRIVWVNGKAQKSPSGSAPDKTSIVVPGKNKPVEIKVGQHFILDNLVPVESESPITSATKLP
ncbi:MAG: hypothetical protein FD173_1560 [Gallionellaceae bacterium]|nr:MAG: hypothetical protein FD173_1560 [Gallionellaceae bacterium]